MAYHAEEKQLDIILSGPFTQLYGSAAEQLAVYSIVNTLTQIEGVETVTLGLKYGEISIWTTWRDLPIMRNWL